MIRDTHRLFARRVGVEVSAHVLNLEFQLMLIAGSRAFEGHVLEEMSHAVVTVSLVPGVSDN